MQALYVVNSGLYLFFCNTHTHIHPCIFSILHPFNYFNVEVEPFWKRVLLPAVAIGGGAAALAAAMPRLETVSTVLNQRR